MNQPTEWPNKAGYTLKVDGGEWELWKPGSTPLNCWIANYIKTGEDKAEKHGEGVNMADAMRNSK